MVRAAAMLVVVVRAVARRLSMRHCGGINPYTLTARFGPGDLAHYETSSKLDPTA